MSNGQDVENRFSRAVANFPLSVPYPIEEQSRDGGSTIIRTYLGVTEIAARRMVVRFVGNGQGQGAVFSEDQVVQVDHETIMTTSYDDVEDAQFARVLQHVIALSNGIPEESVVLPPCSFIGPVLRRTGRVMHWPYVICDAPSGQEPGGGEYVIKAGVTEVVDGQLQLTEAYQQSRGGTVVGAPLYPKDLHESCESSSIDADRGSFARSELADALYRGNGAAADRVVWRLIADVFKVVEDPDNPGSFIRQRSFPGEGV